MECEVPRNPAADPRALGFTLLELAVALMVLAIALAVVVPVVPGALPAAESCVGGVRGKLDRARSAAARDGRRIDLRIGRSAGEDAGPAPAAMHAVLECEGSVEVRVRGTGAEQVGFNALGRAYGGPIEVVDRRRLVATIHLDPWTGSIHVDP